MSFFITSLIIVLLPGTGVLYTVATGMTAGRRESILAAWGCTLGIVPHLLCSLVFTFYVYSSAFFSVVLIVGCIYLIYMGIGMLRSAGRINLDPAGNAYANTSYIQRGICLNLLNPKLTIFFMAFLPQFITPQTPSYCLEYILLGLVFMLMTLIVFICYGIFANMIREKFLQSPALTRKLFSVFGLIFIGFALNGLYSIYLLP